MTSLPMPRSSQPTLAELLNHLDFSMRAELVNPMLHILYDIADTFARGNDKAQAFQILALINLYPLTKPLSSKVESLLDELEFQLCPRVVVDARERAETLTLDEIATELISSQSG
jgi:hypothetical protein